MQPEIWSKVFVVIIFRQSIFELPAEEARRLVCPASSYIANRVSTSTEEHNGHAEGLHELETLRVTFDGEVEETESVTAERVRTTLKDNGFGAIPLHHLAHDWLEELLVARVVYAVAEGNIHRVELSFPLANVIEIASAREEFTKLMEAHRHHPERESVEITTSRCNHPTHFAMPRCARTHT